jgi:hypothetical protein
MAKRSKSRKKARYSKLEPRYYYQQVYKPLNKITPKKYKKYQQAKRNLFSKISIRAQVRNRLRKKYLRLANHLKNRVLARHRTQRQPQVESGAQLATACKKRRERIRRAYFGYLKSTPHGKAGGAKRNIKHSGRFNVPSKCRR